ncbi:MAG: nitrous oxide reductase accessory protein NosL [Chloroflexi bacterium]|nr:nitrous oxide reductase accessory protein NosL [Chloroflexota bacterium]
MNQLTVDSEKWAVSRLTQLASLFTFYFLLFAIAFLLVACAQTTGEPQPPTIAYGRDVCEACGMIISDAKFAAATQSIDGKTYKFDDVGEMFAYHAKHPEIQVRAWFVHDYDSQKWIAGATAFYVISKEIKSPMGTGVVAFADKDAAEAFAGRVNTKVVSFDDARTAKLMGGQGM